MKNLSKIWENKTSILEGLKNNVFKKEHVEEVYNSRLEICKRCDYYDPEGQSEAAIVKGQPSCAACGCALALKLRALSTSCGLTEIYKDPLWGPVIDEDIEDKIKDQIIK